MTYKDPDYMKKWREINKEHLRKRNKQDYQVRRKDPKYRKKKQRQSRDKYHRDPKARRDFRLKQLYGLTAEQYVAMLEAQHGGCAICHTSVPGVRIKFFHVDHDHVTGAVRGLLCSRCNMALGLFQDSPPILEQASKYLVRYRRP